MRIYPFIALFLSLLVGCASTTREGLQRTERNEEIVIEPGFSVVSYSVMNVRHEEGLIPGIFKAEREDADGVYFFGDGRSVWSKNEIIQKIPRLYVGGIYLPKKSSTAPRIFYLFETKVHTTQDVDAYIQQRIVSSTSMPAPGVSVGSTVAGNVIAGALVNGMFEAHVGHIEMFPSIKDEAVVKRIKAGHRRLP